MRRWRGDAWTARSKPYSGTSSFVVGGVWDERPPTIWRVRGMPVVVVDIDPERVRSIPRSYAHVCGDASDDDVLHHAGIGRAAALVAAVSTDAANLFITLSARSLRSDLFIVSRAREDTSLNKLLRSAPTASSTRKKSAACASQRS